MYHWTKNLDAKKRATPQWLFYRGLKFPAWDGYLSRDERRSSNAYYVFFGGAKLTDAAIRHRVDIMIEKGLYQHEAA